MDRAESIKKAVDQHLPSKDGFETHMFKIGSYNSSVGDPFSLPYDDSTMALLILSTPDMFDVAFRKWVVQKTMEVIKINYELQNYCRIKKSGT
ncbi:hypothetical protein B9Z55_006497 [Caenorhabditis nigoni]|uniref:Cyanocobalamin reductase (cyanide-eliminating) n=1 Tax=Caenorhabditis nigoni TaxID=1611254 RepID=A0A2G5V5D5_9PELO|nr:hypothetical protein B9Z55_006497 [Caenorhabditis nigoni]